MATRGLTAVMVILLSLHGASVDARETALLIHAGETPGEAADQRRVAASLRREPTLREVSTRARGAPDLERELRDAARSRLLSLARDRAQQGARLLGRLKLEPAVRVLRKSLDAYAAFVPDDTLCGEMVRPLRDLAFALWQQGEEGTRRAAAVLAGGASLPPSPVDIARYPPPFVDFLRKVHSVQSFTLKLPRLPRDARLYRGCAPAAVSPGEQLKVTGSVPLRLTAPGHRSWSGFVAPSVGDTVVLAALEPLTPLWRRTAPELDSLLDHVGAGWVVFWRRKDGALQIRRYRRGSARPSAWQRLREPEVARPPPPPADRREEHGNWMAPGLLGVGVGALVTATILGVMARNAADSIREAAEDGEPFDERLAELDDRRYRCGTAAYVLWGVGGAATAGALVWWLLDRRSGKGGGRSSTVRFSPTGLVWTRRF